MSKLKLTNDQKKKIAVTGHDGRLGRELVQRGCFPLTCDVTVEKEVKDSIEVVNPDVIIHCASFTEVDIAELQKISVASRVNWFGTMLVRSNFEGQMIYLSTDYVFDGKNGPYKENSPTNPISQYGLTKRYGEDVILDFREAMDCETDVIVRTTILYGGHKEDFVTKVLDHFKTGNPFEVTKMVYGTPTYIPHLAEAILKLVELEAAPPIVNIAGEEVLSRYEFALMIASVFGLPKELIKPTRRIEGIAPRPRRAGLKTDLAKKLGLPIYSVVDGLKAMKEKINKHD